MDFATILPPPPGSKKEAIFMVLTGIVMIGWGAYHLKKMDLPGQRTRPQIVPDPKLDEPVGKV